jgi:hypothetical protein
MYRQKFLKPGIISTGLLMSIFFWNADILRADTPEAPLLPMNVEFRYVPQYLDESIPDDPRYARIQALLDEDGCHVILLDKTTGREAFYSRSKRRVDALAANGRDAYITPVDFTASLPKDASPSFLIHFQDRFGNEVSWKFVVGRIVPHASPEVISRTDKECSIEVIPFPATVFFEAREQFRSEAVVRIRISHCRGLDQPSGLPEQHALKEIEEQLEALGVRRR